MAEDQPPAAGSRRLVDRLWTDVLAPRGWRTDVPVAVLALLLGLGFAITLRTERQSDGLATARPADLVAILADLSTRNEQLQRGIAQLQEQAHELDAGDPGVALQTAREREQQLAILAGTVGAQGPGVVLTVTDPRGSVQSDVLVDAIEELRDAGAEAIDLSGVRIVTQSYVVAAVSGGLDVDGNTVRSPYVLTAIGDPQTLAEALAIPGGVVDAVGGSAGAHAAVEQHALVRISSLRVAAVPRYARPDPGSSTS